MRSARRWASSRGIWCAPPDTKYCWPERIAASSPFAAVIHQAAWAAEMSVMGRVANPPTSASLSSSARSLAPDAASQSARLTSSSFRMPAESHGRTGSSASARRRSRHHAVARLQRSANDPGGRRDTRLTVGSLHRIGPRSIPAGRIRNPNSPTRVRSCVWGLPMNSAPVSVPPDVPKTRPPTSLPASRTRTSTPLRVSSSAATRPARPAPTTTTSQRRSVEVIVAPAELRDHVGGWCGRGGVVAAQCD